jgi:hypothetical protein
VANLDTRLKRTSGLNVGSPWRSQLPNPDGAIAAADRQTVAFMYSGILPDVAANNGSGTVSGTGTLTGEGARVSEGSGSVGGTGTLYGVSPGTARTTNAGVRRARFLRRSHRLPWEEEETDEQQITVATPKRKRIALPAVEEIKEVAKDIPIQTIREISAPSITIPEIGTAVLEAMDDDDDEWLWLI